MDRMGAILRNCGIPFSDHQLQQLWSYHTLLRSRNSELNLTRIHQFDNMVLKLYVDSLLPATLMDIPSPLLDLGTGPGMPGIPLKIFHPELEMILSESRARRVAFLNEVIGTLNLKGIRTLPGKVSERTEAPVKSVITRAVEPIGKTLGHMENSLASGGLAIFMKGPACGPEINDAVKRFKDRYTLLFEKAYHLPGTEHHRRLVVFRRDDAPSYAAREKATAQNSLHTISGPHNPVFIALKKLLGSRGVRKSGKTLVSGGRLVREVLRNHPERCEAWISREDRKPPPPSFNDLKWYCLAPELFDALDVFGTGSPLLLLRIPEIGAWDSAAGFPAGCSVLLPFQDPENLGAAIRSAAALGACQAILLQESAHPFHPRAFRASGGAALKLPLKHGPSLETLSPELPILPLSAEGRNLRTIRFPGAFGLLAGMEGLGLPALWRKRAIAIPMEPGIESLNAAAALAVALYEWSGHREIS